MEKVMLSYRARKWLEILRQCAESGMTKRDYCLEQDINEQTFYYWQRRLRGSLSSSALSLQGKDAKSSPFVRLPIRESDIRPAHCATAAVVRIGSLSIEVQGTADEEFLTRLMRAAGCVG